MARERQMSDCVSINGYWQGVRGDIDDDDLGIENDFFIDSAPPLSNLFYLLQTFLPGMLLVYRIDELDDVGEIEGIRALPCPA